MKKDYGKPEAEKVEFDYKDTVVASGGNGSTGEVEVGKKNKNACYTHNTNNVYNGCQGKPKKPKN